MGKRDKRKKAAAKVGGAGAGKKEEKRKKQEAKSKKASEVVQWAAVGGGLRLKWDRIDLNTSSYAACINQLITESDQGRRRCRRKRQRAARRGHWGDIGWGRRAGVLEKSLSSLTIMCNMYIQISLDSCQRCGQDSCDYFGGTSTLPAHEFLSDHSTFRGAPAFRGWILRWWRYNCLQWGLQVKDDAYGDHRKYEMAWRGHHV